MQLEDIFYMSGVVGTSSTSATPVTGTITATLTGKIVPVPERFILVIDSLNIANLINDGSFSLIATPVSTSSGLNPITLFTVALNANETYPESSVKNMQNITVPAGYYLTGAAVYSQFAVNLSVHFEQ